MSMTPLTSISALHPLATIALPRRHHHHHRRAATIAAFTAAACAVALAAPAAAQLHEGDVAIDVVESALWVGDVEGGEPVEESVFAIAFGDSGIPAFTADPGYNAAGGTFSPASRIGFNFRSALARWNGEGFTLLAGDGAAERLQITFFTAGVISGDGLVSGFDVQVQSDGGFHHHFGMTLLPATGEPAPIPGTYLMELELTSTDPGVETSEPYWFVFDHEADPDDFADAVDHVRDVIAGPAVPPCPADLDGSGAVGFDDVLAALSTWGPCAGACPADLDASGAVGFDDVLLVLSTWGACPE